MGLTDGLAWAASLAGARKRRHDVEGGDKRRQITREAVAEARRDPRDTRLRGPEGVSKLLISYQRRSPNA